MSKKDYIMIAALLSEAKEYLPSTAHNRLTAAFCKMLKADNPNFDEARFIKASAI